jgi:outer membrane receptor for ferrienterochelin and colicins
VQPLVPGLRASLNYTYLDARDDSGERLEKRPRHSGAVKLDWEGGALRAGLRAEYTGEQLLPAPSVGAPAQPAGGFTQFGAYVALALPRGLDLTLVVDNLTDVRLSEQSPLFTHVEPPRTVQLTLRGRW